MQSIDRRRCSAARRGPAEPAFRPGMNPRAYCCDASRDLKTSIG
jgi:hypothetical protein